MNSKKAFTLVELIVVITILAILSTLAFVSFGNFASDARDAKRKSEIQNIDKNHQDISKIHWPYSNNSQPSINPR